MSLLRDEFGNCPFGGGIGLVIKLSNRGDLWKELL